MSYVLDDLYEKLSSDYFDDVEADYGISPYQYYATYNEDALRFKLVP